MSNNKTLVDKVINENDYDNIVGGIKSLDMQLQYLHKKGYYVTKISPNTITCDEHYGFDVNCIAKVKDNDELKYYSNIKDFIKLSLGVYVSLEMNQGIIYNYTLLDDQFIIDNYKYGIRPSIKENVDYYDEMVNSVLFGGFGKPDKLYLYDYQINENKTGASRENKMVKSTPAGKLLSDDNDSAFTKVIFLPLFIACIILTVIIFIVLSI